MVCHLQERERHHFWMIVVHFDYKLEDDTSNERGSFEEGRTYLVEGFGSGTILLDEVCGLDVVRRDRRLPLPFLLSGAFTFFTLNVTDCSKILLLNFSNFSFLTTSLLLFQEL